VAETRYRIRHAGGPVPVALRSVDGLFAAGGVRLLQDGGRATVAAVTLGGDGEFVVKRFRERGARLLEAAVLGSSAARAWRAAARLRAAAFPVPELVAVLERRRLGVPVASCTVARRVSGVPLDVLWLARRGVARRALTVAFADYLRALHAAGLYPQDLRAANVLVAAERPATFVLVDLDRVRRYRRLAWRRRKKNVVQVLRSVGDQAPARERLRFLRRYLGPASRDELRRRATDILAFARRKDAEYARRRRARSPRPEGLP
jgi:Lipopolysaccharide kinase (Kdo/WaaP) family